MNPQRCDSMIAKRTFSYGFVYRASSCSGYHFSCEASVKDKIASAKSSL